MPGRSFIRARLLGSREVARSRRAKPLGRYDGRIAATNPVPWLKQAKMWDEELQAIRQHRPRPVRPGLLVYVRERSESLCRPWDKTVRRKRYWPRTVRPGVAVPGVVVPGRPKAELIGWIPSATRFSLPFRYRVPACRSRTQDPQADRRGEKTRR